MIREQKKDGESLVVNSIWDKREINLGDILENSKHHISFKLLSPLQIIGLSASCGCTKPIHIKETNEIEVVYKAGEVPVHLRYKGSYATFKEIYVYTPDEVFTLIIRATIKMKYFYDK